MSAAGLVAHVAGAAQVEVFESGVGSINFPLVGGPADWRTTRSTHPHFLRLVSVLLSHVDDAQVDYVLPFAALTKGEMVAEMRKVGAEELARRSSSCIRHPLRRQIGGQQCGCCPACVFRRQAMSTAGVFEAADAYSVDLFAKAQAGVTLRPEQMEVIRAFQQQIESLWPLDDGRPTPSFSRYLFTTRVVSHAEQVAPHVEVYRRYRKEWLPLFANARAGRLPWGMPSGNAGPALGAA